MKQKLNQALAACPLFSTPGQTLSVQDGEIHLSVDLAALDTMACAFTRISIRTARLAQCDSATLQQIATQLSSKLTYLLEPIQPIESDAAGCVVQMRSNPPQKDADRTSYYELLLARSGELSLVRYSSQSRQTREIISAHVTREVLCRLAGDLASAVA